MTDPGSRAVERSAPAKRRPAWVAVGMAGIADRRQAVSWRVTSEVLALVLGAGTFATAAWMLSMPIWLSALSGLAIGAVGLAASLWYRSAIRWMDENDAW